MGITVTFDTPEYKSSVKYLRFRDFLVEIFCSICSRMDFWCWKSFDRGEWPLQYWVLRMLAAYDHEVKVCYSARVDTVRIQKKDTVRTGSI